MHEDVSGLAREPAGVESAPGKEPIKVGRQTPRNLPRHCICRIRLNAGFTQRSSALMPVYRCGRSSGRIWAQAPMCSLRHGHSISMPSAAVPGGAGRLCESGGRSLGAIGRRFRSEGMPCWAFASRADGEGPAAAPLARVDGGCAACLTPTLAQQTARVSGAIRAASRHLPGGTAKRQQEPSTYMLRWALSAYSRPGHLALVTVFHPASAMARYGEGTA